jgi:hypothetical protein
MNLKFLKLFEDFTEGKFTLDDIDRVRKEGKKIYASIIKDLPNNDPNQELEIISLDKDTNEVTVSIDNNIYYVDLKNIERVSE